MNKCLIVILVIASVFASVLFHLDTKCETIKAHIQDALKEKEAAEKKAKFFASECERLAMDNRILNSKLRFVQNICKTKR